MNASPKPGRYLYVPVPKFFVVCATIAPFALAFALILGCLAFVIFAHGSNGEFKADPVCTRTIALDSAPATGKSCTIVSGAITRAYTQVDPPVDSSNGDSGSTSDHFDFTTSDGKVLDVLVENAGSNGIFAKAKDASGPTPAVAETFKGTVAIVATSDGMISGQGDPNVGVFLSTGFSVVFGVIAFFSLLVGIAIAVFVRARPNAPVASGVPN